MISESRVKKYCCEDISKIENYELAINDKTQTWDCHHKAEILPCGRFATNDLMKFNLYWNRPANELIFLTHSEHIKLHKINNKNWLGKHHSNETKLKISSGNKNKKRSIETRRKMSKGQLGNEKALGRHWFNNGIKTIFVKECPEGFVKGKLKQLRNNT